MGDDAEVMSFLKEFSALMATHFDVLGKEEAKTTNGASKPTPAPSSVQPAYRPVGNAPAPSLEPLPIDDPNVAAAFSDPEVQALIASLRAGRPMEMHELCRRNPKLFQKVKVLLDAGLLSMEH